MGVGVDGGAVDVTWGFAHEADVVGQHLVAVPSVNCPEQELDNRCAEPAFARCRRRRSLCGAVSSILLACRHHAQIHRRETNLDLQFTTPVNIDSTPCSALLLQPGNCRSLIPITR